MEFQLERYMARLRQAVAERLDQLLPGAETGPDWLQLHAAMRSAVLDGGKRLRPCLALAASEAVGGTLEQALNAACAVELVHCYSLVHDDLPAMDDDDLRRGKPTCHKQYGEAAAILVGDALLTLAFEILAREGVAHPARAVAFLRAAQELAVGAGAVGMVGGQAMDIEIKEKEPRFELVEQCHLQKTAALFTASVTIGALAGGGTDGQVEALRSYGLAIGLAFQHADDLRDADFPQYQALSFSRVEALIAEAEQAARGFGEPGLPLLGLAQLVLERAREAMRK